GGFLEVRGDDGGQGHDVLHEEVLEVDRGDHALAHEHRVEDIEQLVGRQLVGKDQRRVDGSEHSGFDGVEAVHGQRRFELASDDFGVDEFDDVGEAVVRVEGDDAGDDGGAEGSVLLEHLQVGFESCASRHIGAGNGE